MNIEESVLPESKLAQETGLSHQYSTTGLQKLKFILYCTAGTETHPAATHDIKMS